MKKLLTGVLLSILLAGCGFQLRGVASLPFETIFVPGASGGIALDLKRNIQAGTRTRVVDNAKDAQAVVQFSQELREKVILSLNAAGRVTEFQLRYNVGFRVHDGKGKEFVPQNTIALTRDVSFNDAEILSKESEEQFLFRDMQSDMAQLIMRRIAGSTTSGG